MQTPAKFGEREEEGGREIEREKEREGENGMPQAHNVYPSDGQADRQRERERESGMPQAHNVYL